MSRLAWRRSLSRFIRMGRGQLDCKSLFLICFLSSHCVLDRECTYWLAYG